MKLYYRKLFAVVSLGCVLFQLTCGGLEERTNLSEAAAEFGSAVLEYSLVWDTEELQRNETGQWELSNELGTSIRLNRGYLSTYSVQLVECPAGESVALKWFNRLFGLRMAYAGHPNPEDNPAGVYQSVVENLMEMENRTVGVVDVEPNSYCQLHYLVAGANEETSSLPQDVNMLGTSVYLEGSYNVSGSEEWTPFLIHTPLANGVLNNLFADFEDQENSTAMELQTSGEALLIQVERRLAGFFNGLDFPGMTASELERQVLRNIVNHTESTVTRLLP